MNSAYQSILPTFWEQLIWLTTNNFSCVKWSPFFWQTLKSTVKCTSTPPQAKKNLSPPSYYFKNHQKSANNRKHIYNVWQQKSIFSSFSSISTAAGPGGLASFLLKPWNKNNCDILFCLSLSVSRARATRATRSKGIVVIEMPTEIYMWN